MSLDPGRRSRFRARLEATLAWARGAGALGEREYDALLLDPDFDELEFERFRGVALASGIDLPAEGEDDDARPRVTIDAEPERDLLDLYLDEIGRVPLMPHEALIAEARRARAGDAGARKRIILANLRLVVYIARGYRNRGLPLLDLIEEGNLGLIHATDRFEPERGWRFSTYASIMIRQSMLRGLAEQARAVRIPVQMFQQVNRYVRAERALRARLGRDPRPDEMASEMRLSEARARRLAGLIAGLRSLDEASSREAFEQLSAEDLGESPSSVERLVELQLEHEKIDRLLRTLGGRAEQILRIRYGFHDGEARSLAQTGAHFGITRERVRQIEARALDQLRQAIAMQDEAAAGGASREAVH